MSKNLRKVWLNGWAWYFLNDPTKTLHVSRELFLSVNGFENTLENAKKFEAAINQLGKERKIPVIPIEDESFPATN